MQSVPYQLQNLGQIDQVSTALRPMPLDRPPYDESWLQHLIHRHPDLIPAGEIEACFGNPVPVLQEFALPSGFLDNFFITPEGYPVLVEVKLWKNQEARRKVVVQILEYAKDFAALSYEDINAEIRKQQKGRHFGTNPLYEIVTAFAAETIAEHVFVDRVSRNLREGRFLVLVLGDGIREEMAVLARHFLQHNLRYSFGVVEVRLFVLPDGSVLALPSIWAKTQTIERHVTVVTAQGGPVSVLPRTPFVSEEKVEKTSLSQEDFFALMAEKDPQNVVFIKTLLRALSDMPLETEIGSTGESLMLKMTMPGGERVQFALFTPETIELWGIPSKNWKDPEWRVFSLAFLEQVACLVPGAAVKVFNTGANVKQDGRALRIRALHHQEPIFAEAIKQAASAVEAYYSAER